MEGVSLERPAFWQQIIFVQLLSRQGLCSSRGQRFGFDNLRHSLATFLINKEQDTKTVQGLLRHANVSTTLGLYAQSVNASMVEAQGSMLKAILRNGSSAVN